MKTLEEILAAKKISMSVYSKEAQALFVNIGKNESVQCLCKDCTVSVSDGLREKQRLALIAASAQKLVIGCYDCSFVFTSGQNVSVAFRQLAQNKYTAVSLSTAGQNVTITAKKGEAKELVGAIKALNFSQAAELGDITETVKAIEAAYTDHEPSKTFLLGKPYTLNDDDIRCMVEDIDNISRAMLSCGDLYEVNDNVKNLSAFNDYYVPAAQKMIESYSDYCEKAVKPDSFELFEKKVKESLVKIRENFSGIYQNMFSEQALDINKQIEDLQKSFVADGLIPDEANTKAAENIPFEIVVVRDGEEK